MLECSLKKSIFEYVIRMKFWRKKMHRLSSFKRHLMFDEVQHTHTHTYVCASTQSKTASASLKHKNERNLNNIFMKVVFFQPNFKFLALKSSFNLRQSHFSPYASFSLWNAFIAMNIADSNKKRRRKMTQIECVFSNSM